MIEFLAKFFGDGGLFMYFILAVMVLGLAIVGERGYLLMFKYSINAKALWEKVSNSVENGRMEEAKSFCNNTGVPIMRVLYESIDAASAGEKDYQAAVDVAALEVLPSIGKRLPYIATLANIATLFGLLGTIQGLIQAFSAVGSADPTQKAALLAKGISVALYTTAFGLVVAIPFLILNTVFMTKANKIIDEIDEFSVKLINLLGRVSGGAGPVKSERAGEASIPVAVIETEKAPLPANPGRTAGPEEAE